MSTTLIATANTNDQHFYCPVCGGALEVVDTPKITVRRYTNEHADGSTSVATEIAQSYVCECRSCSNLSGVSFTLFSKNK